MSEIEATTGGPIATTVECPFCAEQISARAKKCRHCGETIDVAMRKAEEALRATERGQSNVYMNAAVAAGPEFGYARPVKSRAVAILLALLFGGIGAHKFYLGSPGLGLLYLVFCWTFIPMLISFVEAIIYVLTSDYDFHRRYG